MNKDNIDQDNTSDDNIFLSFIDEERIKDTEIRFSLYIKKVFSFNENKYSKNDESENDDDIDEHSSHRIKIFFKIN